MNLQEKSKDELIKELMELQQEYDSLKATHERMICEKEQMQEEIIKIKDKNRFKIEIVCNMSHEIRTPLNGIWGLSEIILNEELPTSDRKEFFKNINQSSIKLKNIIEDFLEVLFIDCGREPNISETNITTMIEEVYSSLKPNAETKGIQFSMMNTSLSPVVHFRTDGYFIQEILTKTISCFLNFNNIGSIEMGYSLINLSKPMVLEFAVKVLDLYIPSENLQEIFNPYKIHRVVNYSPQETTGLELFIAKSYVELLGGTIRVESIEGKGSTFYFTIPDNPNYEPYPD